MNAWTPRYDDDLIGTSPTYDERDWRNLCVGFIDPLIHKIDDWANQEPGRDANKRDVLAWLDHLTIILHVMVTGIGKPNWIARWERAKIELAVEVSSEFKSEFEAKARSTFDRARATMDKVSRSPNRGDISVDIIDLYADVGAYCEYLRNCSFAFQRRFGNSAFGNCASNDTPTSNTDDSEAYLGLCIDEVNRILTRNGQKALFGQKSKAWQLFIALCKARENGKSRNDLYTEIWGTVSVDENNLDQQKKILERVLEPLRLEVATDKRGIWKLAEIGTR